MLFLIILCVAYAAPLVSSWSQNLNISALTNGFQSTLKNVDSDKNLTKIELLQLATKRGRQMMERFEAKKDHVRGVDIQQSIFPDLKVSTYSMNISIGTPKPVSFTAIMDTGSDLIWTQCKPYQSTTPIFDPRKSYSYSKLNCASSMCKALLPKERKCRNRGDDCMYKFTYGGGSYTLGVLATETFTFERKVSVPKLGFGCAFTAGDFGPNQGLVGLGWGDLSLVSQMKEPKFSYCLPPYDSTETGVLSIGSLATTHAGVKTTPLIKNKFKPSFYCLSLQGITIGKARLPINKTKFEIKKNGTGGLFIDSGSTLTYLEKSAFDQVTKELTCQVKLPSFDGNRDIGLDLCFNITRPINRIKFPNIIYHFEGADFEVIPDNYLTIFQDEKIICLMMGYTSYDGMSVFGNYHQQNALVIYDLAKENLSFLTNTKCTAN